MDHLIDKDDAKKMMRMIEHKIDEDDTQDTLLNNKQSS